MHPSAYSAVEKFAFDYRSEVSGKSVADIGAYNVNGCLRPVFDKLGCKYVGIDAAAGPNVDLVVPTEPPWPSVPDASFDAVVSVSTLEHTRRPWLVVKEMSRILKPSGLACIVAPYAWGYHAYPIDCWRIFPDGMQTIVEDAGFSVVQMYMVPGGGKAPVGDTVCVARKV